MLHGIIYKHYVHNLCLRRLPGTLLMKVSEQFWKEPKKNENRYERMQRSTGTLTAPRK